MCLTASNKYAKKQKAKINILVYKVLTSLTSTSYARSPYRDFIYEFGKMYSLSKLSKSGKNISSLKAIKYRDWSGTRCVVVSEGFHACITRQESRKHMRRNSEIFPAIIPAGSEFYIGDRGDIVANRMSVFRNRKEIREIYGKILPPVGLDNIGQ